MTSYSDQVAIVTGGGGGLGRALSVRLAQLGACVHVADRDFSAAHETAQAIEQMGGQTTPHQVDVADASAVNNLVQRVVQQATRIDLIVNNAGVGIWGPLELVSPEQWRTAIDINLWGTIHGTSAAYRIMIQQGFGQIVNVASLAGLLPVPATVPYATAKHAIVGLSTSLRAEAAAHGIRVNVVCPGPIKTSFFRSLLLAPQETRARQAPHDALSVDRAVAAILRGIDRNKAVVVFPARARFLWRAYRMWPASLNPLQARLVRNLRDAITKHQPTNSQQSELLDPEQSRRGE